MLDYPGKLGKYEVVDCIGRGSMGVVYAGHDPFADRKVAIKVCSVGSDDESQADRVARKLFFNEAHTAGALDHPNILAVLDAGEEGGHPYIVLEFLDGGDTLKRYIEADNLLSVERIVEILFVCAKALDYAHRRGVVHRDIKPTNILLTADGSVKICDFGIAQYAQGEQTQIMGMMGSPRYMSPEQAREEEVTQQTDLYSLGVVAYELLTGKAPFGASNLSKLMQQILFEQPTPLGDLRPEVPVKLMEIVAKAMAKELEQRYRSGQEMAADLSALFSDLEQTQEIPTEEKRFAVLRELSFFNEFGDDEIREIIDVAVWQQFSPLATIVDEGVIEESFYVITSGDVAVMKDAKQISAITKGDCFGEMGYVSKGRRSASIVAIGDVELLRVDATRIQQAPPQTQLRFNHVFLRTLIERLARTSEELTRYVA